MTEDARKRLREDDSCDFMPLSKRINNLHLTNHHVDESHHVMQNLEFVSQHQFQNHLQQQLLAAKNDFNNNQNHNGHQNEHIEHYEQYNPSLNESENPHYYTRNKILYELYMDRERRLLNDGMKRSC